MAEEMQEQAVEVNSFDEMMKLFEEMSFWEKWRKIREGLRQPKDSGPYKWAKLQMLRLMSPLSGVVVPLLLILVMGLLAGLQAVSRPPIQVQIRDETVTDELKPPEDIPEPEIQPPEPTDIVQINDTFIPSTSKETSVGPDADFSPQPSPFDAVAIIKSPVIMKGVFGNRSPGARGSALGRFGGSGSTEGAVMRALRWLKKHQEPDGRWTSTSGGGIGRVEAAAACTGWALLAYLGHGETPASPEFGATVDKAIKWLLKTHEAGGGWFPRSYQHSIATYALCEAYSMTKLPSLKAAGEKSVEYIIQAQNPMGGWRYEMNATDADLSHVGWAVQCLKAAKIGGINPGGMDNAMKKAIDWVKGVYLGNSSSGVFGYVKPERGHQNLTGVGILCLQLLGQPKADQVKGGLAHLMATGNFRWEGAIWKNVYWWYYDTQARFHEGGECWKTWNKQFSLPLVKAQIVIPQAIEGPGGRMYDIGYWDTNNDRAGRVMDTTLCTLMLEVYYRYLPTFQKPEEFAVEAAAAAAGQEEEGIVKAKDLDIEIKM